MEHLLTWVNKLREKSLRLACNAPHSLCVIFYWWAEVLFIFMFLVILLSPSTDQKIPFLYCTAIIRFIFAVGISVPRDSPNKISTKLGRLARASAHFGVRININPLSLVFFFYSLKWSGLVLHWCLFVGSQRVFLFIRSFYFLG